MVWLLTAVQRHGEGPEHNTRDIAGGGEGLFVGDVLQLSGGVAVHKERLPQPELDRTQDAVPQIVEHAARTSHMIRIELARTEAKRVQSEGPEAEVGQHDESVDRATVEHPIGREYPSLVEVIRAERVVREGHQEPNEVGAHHKEVPWVGPAQEPVKRRLECGAVRVNLADGGVTRFLLEFHPLRRAEEAPAVLAHETHRWAVGASVTL